jgi:RNA polymerase-binding transcription factor DksA
MSSKKIPAKGNGKADKAADKTTTKGKAVAAQVDERTSYSKEELEEFRAIINEKLAESRDEYKGQQEILRNSTEMAADGYNLTEFGSEMSDREQAEMLLARTGKFINALERALVRIENGTYGRCKVTGKLIPKERLRMVPHTETSIEAKLAQPQSPPMSM